MKSGSDAPSGKNFNQISIDLLRVTATGRWFTESVALDRPGTCTRISFAASTPSARVFVPEFSDALSRYLPESFDGGRMTDDGAFIDLPGLCLAGIDVNAEAAALGTQKVRVCFREALGALQSLLLPVHRSENASNARLDDAAGAALLNILHPCLDIVRCDISSLRSEASARVLSDWLTQLQEKRHDLEFFSTMLTRYLTRIAAPAPLTVAAPEAANRAAEPRAVPPVARNGADRAAGLR